MCINGTEYHVDLVTAISNILFNLFFFVLYGFEIFTFGEEVLIYGTH